MPRTPSIRNWRNAPPNGGWSLVYHPPEHPEITIDAQGHSYTKVLEVIRNWRVNNELPPDDNAVFQWANAQWCERDPKRCVESLPPQPESTAIAGLARRTLTPEDYGRACWTYLNTFGVYFDQAQFLSAIEHIKALLNPKNPHNNGSGCPTCHAHFFEFCQEYPPHHVTTAEEAAVWVWMAHDAANVNSGKAHRPKFRHCTAMFGWPILDPDQFDAIKARLHR